VFHFARLDSFISLLLQSVDYDKLTLNLPLSKESMLVSPIVTHPRIQACFIEACKEVPLSDYAVYWDLLTDNSIASRNMLSSGRFKQESLLLNVYLISCLAHSHNILLGSSFALNEGGKGFNSTMAVFKQISHMCDIIYTSHYSDNVTDKHHVHTEHVEGVYIECLCNLVSLTQRFCGTINSVFQYHKIKSVELNTVEVKSGNNKTSYSDVAITVMKEFQQSLYAVIQSNKFLSKLSSHTVLLLLYIIQYELYTLCEVPSVILEALYSGNDLPTCRKVAIIPIKVLLDVGQIIDTEVLVESDNRTIYEVLVTLFKNRNIWQDLDIFKLDQVFMTLFVSINV
jgi:hypothetical protein